MTTHRDHPSPSASLTRRALLRRAAGTAVAGLAAPFLPLAAAEAPPAPPAAAVTRIAFGSCLRRSAEGAILDTIASAAPERFLWLGDNIYADTEDMAVMRAKYGVLAANPRFQRLLAACPNHAIWDDHDYGRNDAGAEYPQRAASQREFCDFWKLPADDLRRTRAGVHHRVVHGAGERAVRIIMLDGRSFRGAPNRPGTTVLGEDQWAWLAEELRQPAALRVVCSGYQVLADHRFESWNRWPHERQRLFDLVRGSRAGGVLLLSGDRHHAELTRAPGALGCDAWELTSSSLDQAVTEQPNPQRVGAPVLVPNFGMITVEWDAAPRVVLEIHDGTGAVVLSHSIPLADLVPA